MRRRSRFVCVLVWIGAALSLALLASVVIPARWMITWGSVEYGPAKVVILPRGILLASLDGTSDRWRGFWLASGWRYYGSCYYWDFDWPRATTDTGYRIVAIPHWSVAVPTAALTLLLASWNRRVRPPGTCRRCGYNLTGNTSGRCPECGVEVGPQTKRGQRGKDAATAASRD